MLGIDVGGTKIALCVGDAGGEVRARSRRPTGASGDPRADVDRMAGDARALLAEAGLAPADLGAVGLSLPGPIDHEGGRVVAPPNLRGWGDVPVRDWLRESLDGVAVEIENDANAAALAEWRFGAGRGTRSMVYLTMSTGVGGGIVEDGRVLRGRTGSAGEVGHIPLVWDGEVCGCGRAGCAEAYLGGRCWAERLARTAPPDGRVAALAGGREQATPEHVVAAAREGDAFALAEIDRFNRYLTQLLVALGFVLDPDCFVLGTIAVAAGDELVLDPVRAQVRERLWPRLAEGLEIRPAALGPDLPYYAGLCVALAASEASETAPG